MTVETHREFVTYMPDEFQNFPKDLMHFIQERRSTHEEILEAPLGTSTTGDYETHVGAFVDKFSIGIAAGTAKRYVMSLGQSLLRLKKDFTLWAEFGEIDGSGYDIYYDGISISTPADPGEQAIHFYIEHEGYAFDSYKAFNGNIPIAEYQEKIKGDSRKKLDVDKNSPQDEFVRLLNSLN